MSKLVLDFKKVQDFIVPSAHDHICYEIIYICSGTISLTLDTNKYLVTEESLIFISPYEQHSISIVSAHYERYFMTISPEVFNNMINNPILTTIFRMSNTCMPHIVHAPENSKTIFEDIFYEYQQKNSFMDEYICCRIKELLISVFRTNPIVFDRLNSNSFQIAYKVAIYIEENYFDNLLIGQIANEFFVDKYHLAHVFKSAFGYSPKSYLIKTRILHVKQMLLTTTSDLEIIAAQTGFSNANSLVKIFKKEVGITPGCFRKTYSASGS